MKKAVGVFWLKMQIYDYCDQTVEKVVELQRLKISSNPPNKALQTLLGIRSEFKCIFPFEDLDVSFVYF